MPIEVLALAPLAAGTLVWRDGAGAPGQVRLTVVAKATLEIRPEHRARLVAPYPLFGDIYFEQNDGRSLRVASDHAPAKARADVLFTGAAYAPVGERVTHRTVRLAVARDGTMLLDKKLLVIGSRERDRGGTPTPPQPFAYVPLRWELAAGGPASRMNPVGVGDDPGDTRLPSVVDPSDPKRPAGLGPVPPAWPSRRDALGSTDPASFAVAVPTLGAGVDLAYFNAAPRDQQLPELQGDESILMSGLHPAIAEMTWRLPGQRAHALVEVGGTSKELPLVLDTLWIEGEMLRCVLTWRASLIVESSQVASLDAARVSVTLAKNGAAPAWDRRPPAALEPSVIGMPAPPRGGAPDGPSMLQQSSAIELELEHSMIFAPKSEKKSRLPRREAADPPLVNDTGLHAWVLPWQVKPPEYSNVVIVKATFLLGDDGSLTRAPEQDPPSGDVAYEPDETTPHGTSLRYASDFAVFKPAADVLLVGHAYPAQESSGMTNVELRVGELRRRIAVFGDRRWGGFTFDGKPARFTKMPLRWERAMGGPLSDANPVGRGYRTGVLAPNLERPESLVTGPDDRPPPACLGPVPPGWKARREKTGTFDAAWMRDRWPYLPADWDWSHFNAAPPEQQVPYLRGDERFSIVGVRPGGGGFEGRLPGLRPRVFAQRTDEVGGDFFEIVLRIDTAWFDTDAKKVVLVWRGLYATPDDDSPDLAALFVDLEQGDTTRTIDEERQRFLARAAAGTILPMGAMAFPEDDAAPEAKARPLPRRPDAPSRDQVIAMVRAGTSLARRDLTAVNLEGADLTGADLTGAILAQANLRDAVLARARLAGAVLSGARADRASFVDADLAGADLTGARLARAAFDRANLDGAVADGVHAVEATWVDARATRASFVGAFLDDAKLTGAKLASANFTGASIARGNFARAVLDDATFYGARGERAVFDGAAMADFRADGARFAKASFAEVQAEGSVWEGADLTGAQLPRAQLARALFLRTKLDEATLSRATATDATFRRASLKRAKCTRANLMQATFERADLTEADLRWANLYQADTWRAKMGQVDLAGANVPKGKVPRR